jgi:photosystem II stability/assembly factor-like uncharacterized protein
MSVCLSHGGSTMYAAASPSERILVGTVNGVVAVERDGKGCWQVAGTSLAGSHISVLFLEPTSGVLFAGVHKDGIYASRDDGQTWERRDTGLTQKNVYSMGATTVDSTTRLYAGTEPAHLFVSKDLGATWTELPALRAVESVPDWTFPAPPHVAHVKNLAFDPTDPNRIYAGVEQGGLLRSGDGGQSWVELYGVDEDTHRVVAHPTRPGVVYLATGNGLYRSDNGGERWKHITPRTMRIGYPDPMVLHPKQDGLMFIAGARHGPEVWHSTKSADAAIARSRDGGQTWEVLQAGLPERIRGNIGAMVMETHDGGFELYACGTDGDVFHSADGGDSWTTVVSGLPPLSKGGHHMVLKVQPQPAVAGAAG